MNCPICGENITNEEKRCPKCNAEINREEEVIKVPEPYEVYEKIGAGGGGTVYKAYDKNLRKYVVIKKIHDTIKDEDKQRVEVDILKNLHHQYLPQVFSYFQIDGVGYTVMDYVEGESLRDMLDRGVRFKQKQVIKYAQQLIEAVKYLHAQKIPIYHGDIKPDNIMLTPEDNICLIDFNVSGITTEGKAMTFGFTPGYGAPEQYADFRRIQQLMQEVRNRQRTADINQNDSKDFQNNKTEILIPDENNATEILPANANGETEILVNSNNNVTELLQPEEQGSNKKTNLLWADQKNASEEKNKQDDVGTKIELSEGIIIDRRTDIYSIGATLYHLITGVQPQMGNNKNVTELAPNISDGLAYLVTKSMMQKPESRYKDCDAMLKTIHQIDKMDRRYKRLNRLEYLLALVLCLALAGSVAMIQQGKVFMEKEKEDEYSGIVSRMADARSAGDYDSMIELLGQATSLYPNNSDAYYEMTLAYYDQKQYEKCKEFIIESVFSNEMMEYGLMEDSFYFLSANSCFELEDYEGAAEYYEKAILLRPNEPDYYRDYVITLARLKRISEAREALEKARKIGVEADTLCLLEGEIFYIDKQYTSAEESLMECISNTGNNEILSRAYSKLDEVYEQKYSGEELYDKKIELLEEAVKKVSKERGIVLMERLAQAYMDRADITLDMEDNYNAIRVLESIRSLGYGTFQTDYNMALLYEKCGDYEKTIEWIKEVIGIRGEDYRWYKRMAYTELERQNTFDNSKRDYMVFKEYYDKMNELYAESGTQTGDMEMQVLKQLYDDLVEQKWLE